MHTYFPFPLSHVAAPWVDFGSYVLTITAGSFGSVKIQVSLCFWASSVPMLPSHSSGGRFPCCREGTKAWCSQSELRRAIGGVVQKNCLRRALFCVHVQSEHGIGLEMRHTSWNPKHLVRLTASSWHQHQPRLTQWGRQMPQELYCTTCSCLRTNQALAAE